jgi:hypothetical protein
MFVRCEARSTPSRADATTWQGGTTAGAISCERCYRRCEETERPTLTPALTRRPLKELVYTKFEGLASRRDL